MKKDRIFESENNIYICIEVKITLTIINHNCNNDKE